MNINYWNHIESMEPNKYSQKTSCHFLTSLTLGQIIYDYYYWYCYCYYYYIIIYYILYIILIYNHYYHYIIISSLLYYAIC